MQWALYVFGAFGYALLYTALLTMHIYRYDPGEPNPYGWPVLASSALVGVAALLSRIFNPFASIVVGYLSDKTSSRWGRRRPFMAIALLPMLAGFVFVFTPPFLYVCLGNVAYLTVTLIVFFLAFSVYMTPYLALLAEIARTTKQRVQLSMLVAISNLLGNAVGLIAAPWLVERLGFLNMALILSAISLISLVAPLAIKEDANLPRPKRMDFWNSVQTVGQNPTFRPYLVSQIAMWFTINIIYLCSNHFVIAMLHRDIGFGSVVNGVIMGGTIIGFVPINLLTKYWGKKATLRLSLIWLGISLLGLGVWPLWIRDTLWLCLALLTLFGAGLSGLFILPNAMLADIVDEDAKQTGVQRGAIYFGVQAMVVTVSSGLASLLAGAILMLGKTPVQSLGVQLIYPVAGFFALGAAWILADYPLSE